MQSRLRAPAQETAVRCRIAASASLWGSAETIAQWRRQPIAHGAHTMPASFLKHSDDQAVLALRAVFAAIAEQGWQERSFADWGIVAAPNLFGRVGIAQTIQRFQAEGAWAVSPHLIPHLSLHATSGTISQALSMHGPNFGVGGGADAFLIAAAMLADGGLPGLWLVLTGYECEWIPAVDHAVPAPLCQGVALALTNGESGAAGLVLSIGQARPGESATAYCPEFQLGAFTEELTGRAGVPALKWRLTDSHWLELDAEIRP